MSNDLKKKAVRGVAWTTISTVVRSIVSLLQISILTKYLSKEDFGIVAIATLFIGFTQIFIDLGLSSGILHKKSITTKEYSSLFWLNCFTGIIVTSLLICISPLIARIYGEPSLTGILSILSLSIFFASIGFQQATVLQKKFRFKYIAVITIISSILTLTMAIYLARTGWAIYSLVLSTVFYSAFSNILFLVVGLVKDNTIKFHFKVNETIPFLKIGIYSLGTNALDYFSREIDILLISSFLGTEKLGVYSLCKRIVTMMYGAIGPILNKVFTPFFANLQGNISHLRGVYYRLIESVSLITCFVFFIVSIFSTFILTELYGADYVEYGNLLSILSLTYAALSTGCLITPLQISLGRTDSGFYWTICRILLSIIFVFIGVQFNLISVAISLFVMHFFASPISWNITIKPLIKGTFKEYFIVSNKVFFFSLLLAVPFYIFLYNQSCIFYIFISVFVYSILYAFIALYKFQNSYTVEVAISFFDAVCSRIKLRKEY